ncbi:MAG: winged helix-turn-helix domain-containing protein, partial [Kangiellaceae bacterium]
MVDFKFIYQFGDFYLDPKSQAFYFQTQEIKLEPRIFDVLHLMVQKPGEVITKDEFFESVWQGKVVSDWALSRAIKVLRKILQEYDENETVKTLYGKGYLFSYEVKVLEPEVYKELVTSTPNNGVETIEQAILHHGVSTPAQRPDASKNITSQATAKKVNTEEGRLKYQTLLALILLSVLVIFFLFRSNDEHPTKDKAGIKSIVVLPITNISGSEEYEYLASGLTDVVIGQLAKEKSLKVISKTSASYYKNKNMTSKAIAEELNVETVLEGSIFPNKDKINLSFRLIDGKSEKLIWSVDDQEPIQEVYTLFKGTAEKLARRIVANSISGSQSGLVQEKTNSETYELYLRANFILNSRKAKNLQKAEAFLLLAIEK